MYKAGGNYSAPVYTRKVINYGQRPVVVALGRAGGRQD